MSSFVDQLRSAADRIADVPRHELQVLLRRAAIRLDNASSIALDEDVGREIDKLAAEYGQTRNDAIRGILRDWLETSGLLTTDESDEGAE